MTKIKNTLTQKYTYTDVFFLYIIKNKIYKQKYG
jgi:hypothetical protein